VAEARSKTRKRAATAASGTTAAAKGPRAGVPGTKSAAKGRSAAAAGGARKSATAAGGARKSATAAGSARTSARTIAPRAPQRRAADMNGDSESAIDVALLETLLDALGQASDGDFKVRLSTRRKGIVGELHQAFNELAERNTMMNRELQRIGRVIGREGRMTERASLGPVGGAWEESIESINALIDDLVRPTTEVARVIDAVADGDLNQKMALEIEGQPVKGEFLRIGTTVNAMVDQLSSFADEVTRVAREVGTEGQLGGQAQVQGVSGTWRDLTENVNFMASNLTDQVRNISHVTTAVANGDLSQKITVAAKGEVAQLADTINTMVDRLRSFAAEVTRVAREVGTDGKLGGQAEVEDVSGTWRDLTESVNLMASNLTDQVRSISQVSQAVARGDLTQKITVEARGEVAELATTINEMTDTLAIFADQVTGVAREVGTDGKLGGQAEVPNVAGTWKDLTENVNLMASNLTDQVRSISQVSQAVARGDLTQKITVEARGEVAELADTINEMTDTLAIFADQVTGVAREVGTEGILGGQAEVPNVAGTWKDLTDSVNLMAGNLTSQVRNIAQVTTAVANGDLSQQITVDVKGEMLDLKRTINTMVDQLSSFADEVTRVAREVGTDGILGGQAEVTGVSGTWRDLTENVNFMAGNLTTQVRSIASVATAVARGDLTQKITVEARGEVAALADTINEMTDTLATFADQVTGVAREVGTEGILGGQAEVPNVAGTWKDLTENVNLMAGNLTTQVRNISQVTTAVAKGDLSQKITADAKGEILELKNTINTMVDQLSSFADEVTRVAREVGTEGKLGGQAEVKGVSGTWRDLTENVNLMAGNLTDQVRNISQVAVAVAEGDLSQKISVEAKGEVARLADTLNTMVDRLRSFAAEVTRVAREVGTEGMLGGQAEVEDVSGTWRGLTENVNLMATNLTDQVRNIAQVTTAVANGDLSKKITVDAKGEILELKDTINTMVDQLNSFAAEVTRVAKEVGTEGKLGGQAEVAGVSGTWRGLTESVNSMAGNLTDQVRNISQVATAVANGDLTQKITVDAKGEILDLKQTLNIMVDQLSSFAAEVTRVAKEVGTEGKLGGQAQVEGVSGTWRGLTENVNQLAGTLTTQLRAIAEVSTAVTQGDLTRSITVDASGEVADLKDNINQMIANLRETTERNESQDWLNSNLARFSGLMQGQRDLGTVSKLIMSELTPTVNAQFGAFFLTDTDGDGNGNGAGQGEVGELALVASYGYKKRKNVSNRFKPGEALVGQAALEKKPILITEPPDDYIHVASGLGEATPRNIIVLPVLFEEQVLGVMELASFRPFDETIQQFLDQLMETIGVVLSTIIANMRTEDLLQQSQSLTQELQSQSEELQSQQDELKRSNAELEEQAKSLKASEELLQTQQEELQQTNEELQEKAALLSQQNRDIEIKNREIELARASLEEKAEQLALSSKYKSEFLANMSHELRTPLNSLLILSNLLAANEDENLSEKQIEFANTIHQAGSDLLALINDILDIAKVEAGKMDVHPSHVGITQIRDYVERSFRPLASQKELGFEISIAEDVPTSIETDEQRLEQVLKNLLSNAFKFTEQGGVTLRIERAPKDLAFASEILTRADGVLAFAVSDSGIGVADDKLKLIFEAFQQADGTTSRKYGGTGLGLSISREITRLLGGEIKAESTLGEGSTFTLYLPENFIPVDQFGGSRTSSTPDVELPVPDLGESEPETEAEPQLVPAPSNGDRVAAAEAEAARVDEEALALPPGLDDDRASLLPGDRVFLLIEDDEELARTALELGHERGFKGLIALRGEAGLALAHEYKPDAILLSLQLPITDGSIILEHLKRHPDTRHIPVHVMSDADHRQEVLRAGAVGYIDKPLSQDALGAVLDAVGSFIERRVKNLLVVEDDDTERDAIIELIGSGDDVDIVGVGSSEEALAQLSDKPFDCMVLDLKLPDGSGFQLLEKIKKTKRYAGLPVIVHTGRDLTRREETRLKKYADTIIVKDVRSPERLLDETSLFLHRIEARLPHDKRKILEQLHNADAVFEGKKVLIVDDDVRNVFALASVFEGRGMDVLFAENGREGLATLQANPDVDLVLMDIMMPEMDGYETTRAVRDLPEFQALPIVALTAKAMKGDREKSIASGASDYITKPVDVDQLLSLMRVWLYQ
jgi:HAMP domain-containing protein/signal transduction histidine kinase/DNA-binding response OmpR family regulator